MRPWSLVWWVPVLLVGCGRGSTERKLASTLCERMEECFSTEFPYADTAECEEDVLDSNSATEDCDLDGDAADACTEAIADASCDDLTSGAWTSSCSAVYDCDGEPMPPGGSEGLGGFTVPGGGGGEANVQACEAFLDQMTCGEVDFGQYVYCSAYAMLPCDISDYFGCLTDHTVCTDGVPDMTGWEECTSLAVCV